MKAIPRDLVDLEESLFDQPAVPLTEIKTTRYEEYAYGGVYLIYDGDELVKVGKTVWKEGHKERGLADRVDGLSSQNDSPLRRYYTNEQANKCTVKAIEVVDPVLRGRLEYYLIGKYAPKVNHDELRY